MPQCPHDPARHQQSTHKHGEAVEAVANHVARSVALRNAEDRGRKYREQQRRVEVGEGERVQGFFPMAM